MTEQHLLYQWRDVLVGAGWDALANDLLGEVAARMDRAPSGGLWTLGIDHAGRFKLKVTYARAGSVETQCLQSVDLVTVAIEDRHVMTIMGRLDLSADLKLVLRDLDALIMERVAAMRLSRSQDTSA